MLDKFGGGGGYASGVRNEGAWLPHLQVVGGISANRVKSLGSSLTESGLATGAYPLFTVM